MPQIDALTVAEHRAQQREALVDAAPLGPAVRARIDALAYRPAAQLVQGVGNAGVRLLHSRSIHEVEPLTVSLAQTLGRSCAGT